MRSEKEIQEEYNEFEIPEDEIPEYKNLNYFTNRIKKISILRDGNSKFDVQASNK
jgi:hypothetical protein